MPMYDFRCMRCEFSVERIVPSDTDTIDVICPHTTTMCALERVISPPHVHVKLADRAAPPSSLDRYRNSVNPPLEHYPDPK